MALSFTPDPTLHDAVPILNDVEKYKRYALEKYRYLHDLRPMQSLLANRSLERIQDVLGYFKENHEYALVIESIVFILSSMEANDDLYVLFFLFDTLLSHASLPTIRTALQRCQGLDKRKHERVVYGSIVRAIIARPFMSEQDRFDLLQTFIEWGLPPGIFAQAVLKHPNMMEFILVHYHDRFTRDEKNTLLRVLGNRDPRVVFLRSYDPTDAQPPIPDKLSFTPDTTILTPPMTDIDAYEDYVVKKYIHQQDLQPMHDFLSTIDPKKIMEVVRRFWICSQYTLLFAAIPYLERTPSLGYGFDDILLIVVWCAPLPTIDNILQLCQMKKIQVEGWVSFNAIVRAIRDRPFTSEQDKLHLLQQFIASRKVLWDFLGGLILYISNSHFAEFILVYYHDAITPKQKNTLLERILLGNPSDLDSDVLPLLVVYGAGYDHLGTLTEEQLQRYRTAYDQALQRIIQTQHASFPNVWTASRVLRDTYIAELLASYHLFTPDWKSLLQKE